HRNFLCRQGGKWSTAGQCYQEFLDGEGLGSTLSAQGMQRYVSRLERLHAHGFEVETPVVAPVDEGVPLVLHKTNCYVESRYHCEILRGMGYLPTLSKEAKKKEKKEKKSQEDINRVRALIEPGPAKGVKRPRDSPSLSSLGRGRGKRFGVELETMRVCKGTIADMMSQIGYLKAKVDGAERECDRQRRRAERLDADYYRQKREIRSGEIRCREKDKMIEKISADHYHDNADWSSVRREWLKEKEVLLNDIEDERRRVSALQGKLSVYEKVGKKTASRNKD
ncbi:MAG: hypothetical protein GY696_12715, partial [Gammaproteobacteria bacterium]|nr:hypothetical protein [Gammaproteobacteria bacterium]